MMSQMIREHEEELLHEWVKFAHELEGTDTLNESALLDEGRDILRALADDIEAPQSDAEQVAKSKGKGPYGLIDTWGTKHSSTRMEQGLDLYFVVAEYRALRDSVTRKWLQVARREDDAIMELVRFNQAVDQALIHSASEHARQTSLERDNLEAMLAHDLRTPLAAIRFSVEASSKHKVGKDKARLERCIKSADKMDRLIEALLDVTRLRRGQCLKVTPQPMDMAALVRDCVAEIQSAHPHADIRTNGPDRVPGTWDPDRMSQVFNNLLSNAIKHGAQEQTVTVALSEEDDGLSIGVHNHGKPIEPDEVARIFDPYMRSERSVRQSGSGVGLGLHIVKQIIIAHEGDVQVTSSLRQGTRFAIKLPRTLSKVAHADAQLPSR